MKWEREQGSGRACRPLRPSSGEDSASARGFTLIAPAEAMGPLWLTQGTSLRRAARKWGWKLRAVRGLRLCLRQKDSVSREPASGAGSAVMPSPGGPSALVSGPFLFVLPHPNGICGRAAVGPIFTHIQ